MEYGKTIRGLRKKAKLSQNQLAHKIGVSHTQVSHWECGRKKPSASSLAKLATGLGVTVDALMGRAVP